MTSSSQGNTSVFRLLGGFFLISALLGVLGAGVAVPAVAMGGSSIKGGVSIFNELPANLSRNPLSQQSRILDANGKTIATVSSKYRIIMPLNKIAPIMQKAQLAIEDARFYEHGGLDVRGLMRAMAQTANGNSQGASTITQQYVKLSLQEAALESGDKKAYQEAAVRTGVEGYARKMRELKMAVKLEEQMSKQDILAGYLNIAFYGDRAYGVEAASRHYFGIKSADLNYLQSALLAGIVQAPDRFNPITHPQESQARRDVVLQRMADLGVITAKQAAAGKKVPVSRMLNVKEPKTTCFEASNPYFCDYVMTWLKKQPALGKTPEARLKAVQTGGFTIRTAFDVQLSKKMRKYLTKKVPVGDKSGVGSAAVTIQPGTGYIVGMAQTSDYASKGRGTTEINWNVDEADGGGIGFQIGSTAKMYALVTALESGMSTRSSVLAKQASTTKPATYTNADNSDRGTCPGFGTWNVHNDFNAGGNISLAKATAQSINSAFASLVMKLGVCKVNDTTKRMHLHLSNGDDLQPYPAAVTLGAAEISPLTLAASYATLANNGTYCPPRPVVAITGPDQKALKFKDVKCESVIDPDVAAGVTALLRGPIQSGTATNARLAGGRDAAGKTGTTDSHKSSYFVGYTPQLATAVFVGGTKKAKPMRGITIGGVPYGNVFGGTIAAPLWKQVMDEASADLPSKRFSKPSSKIIEGVKVDIPSVAGKSYKEAAKILSDEGFQPYPAGQVDSTAPKGTVIGTTPAGKAQPNSPVGVAVSSGVPPKPKPAPTAPGAKPGAPAPAPANPPNNQSGGGSIPNNLPRTP